MNFLGFRVFLSKKCKIKKCVCVRACMCVVRENVRVGVHMYFCVLVHPVSGARVAVNL